MGGYVEGMISGANAALVDRDHEAIDRVIADDSKVDLLEKQIDEQCLEIMARHQPVAGDLRLLVTVMKITNDLERVGDCAVNISKSARVVNEEPPLKPYIDMPRMIADATGMIHDGLDAFVTSNSELASEVMLRDKQIDRIYRQLFRELLMYMLEQPQTITRALHLLLIARDIERIGDHAANVCEDVIYWVEGRDVRHPKAEKKIAAADEAE
jgi:phosphate transport system protein